MSRKQIAIATMLVILVGGATWAMGFFDANDLQVAELEQMRDENIEKIGEMSDGERRKQFEGFREKIQNLSEDQRRQFFESSRPMFQQMINQRLDSFFAKSPEEQTVELDRRIDQMEERRKNRENNEGARGNGDRGWGNRADMTPQQQDQRRKERLDRSTPELRGKMDRFRDMMNERREQRGLDPMSGRGMFGGR